MQHRTSVPALRLRQLPQTLAQSVIIPLFDLILERRPLNVHQHAGLPYAQPKALS